MGISKVSLSTDSFLSAASFQQTAPVLIESAVMGNHVVALCGEVFPVTRAAKPGSPVCPDCKRIYEQLKRD